MQNLDNISQAAAHYTQFLKALGLYDIEINPEMVDTPLRVAKMIAEMTSPIPFNMTFFKMPVHENGQTDDVGIVLQKDIAFASLCSHHMLPFYGIAHVAYIPNRFIVGLSKLARAVEFYAHNAQTQENLGMAICDELMSALSPIGVAVILKATHTCMSCRGAKAYGTTTTTSTLRGAFFTDPRARSELFDLMRI